MRRSARSIATGPGSRGGHWHDAEYRREWRRRWRAQATEYRGRDNQRRAEAKRARRLERDRRWVDELL